jgi:branched-chain amino acid aminotransferase
MKSLKTNYTWINDEMVASDKATVPFLTSGFHYGIAVFEGIRAYQTPNGLAVFRLREHMQRFDDSARIVGFRDLPKSVDEMMKAVCDTVRENGFGDCYIRPLLWLADGGWSLTIDTGKPHVAVSVWEQSVYVAKAAEEGLKACVSSFARHHPNAMMTKAKVSGNYANSILAKTDAQRTGFDEAILLDPEGYVAECTGANLFVVRHGHLVTPPTDAILEGITRDTVVTLAKDLGIPVTEGRLSRDHLYVAEEVFVCGTAAEVQGITHIDGRQVGWGVPGPVTTQLREAYLSAVRGSHPRSEGWLTYV